MNKTLITSISAAALTSAASAFTLDLSTLEGTNLGTALIIQNGATFSINAGVANPPGSPSGQITAGGALTTNINSTVIIDYDESQVHFTGFDAIIGSTFTDDGGAITLTTGSVQGINFAANVPEPSSTALLGLGSLALILRRRK